MLLQYLQAWQDVSGCDSEEAVVAYWRARGYTEFDFDHDGSLSMSLTTPGGVLAGLALLGGCFWSILPGPG